MTGHHDYKQGQSSGLSQSLRLKMLFEITVNISVTGCVYLFIDNGTLDFANRIKTIDHIGLILSEIHILI